MKCYLCKKREGAHINATGKTGIRYYTCNPCNTKRHKKYIGTAHGKKVAYQTAIRYATKNEKNREKRRVWGKVNNRRKSIPLKPCVKCGNPKTVRHHEDYKKPFDVIHLCYLHHNRLHISMKKILEKHVDTAFSIFIRKRDNYTCQYCGRRIAPPTNLIQCSHFYTRTARSVRYDPENADAMCRYDHRFLEQRKNSEYLWWKKEQLGEKKFTALKKRYVALKVGGFSQKERQAMLKKFKHET